LLQTEIKKISTEIKNQNEALSDFNLIAVRLVELRV